MAAGDFSPSVILQIKLKAEEMWKDSQYASSLETNSVAAQAILANQTARITPLSDPEKDNTVKINWINTCNVVAEDCESNCDLDEAELESAGKDYALDICKKSGFSIDAEKLRTNTYDYEEQVAAGLNASIRELDEFLAQQSLVKLKAFAGINVAPAPWTYAGNTTTIPDADYNLGMVAKILRQARLNRISNPYFINNGDLWEAFTNAQLQAGNLDGKGDVARIQALGGRFYFDDWNFGPAGLTESLFMVAPGAVAFATQNRHSDTPKILGGSIQQTRFTVRSKTLPGIKYDAFYKLSCKTVGSKEHIMHTFRLVVNAGIFLNPEGCPVTISGTTYSPTGVISYTHAPAV